MLNVSLRRRCGSTSRGVVLILLLYVVADETDEFRRGDIMFYVTGGDHHFIANLAKIEPPHMPVAVGLLFAKLTNDRIQISLNSLHTIHSRQLSPVMALRQFHLVAQRRR